MLHEVQFYNTLVRCNVSSNRNRRKKKKKKKKTRANFIKPIIHILITFT